MSLFQLLAVQINLGGDRNSVIFRTRHNQPVTYPEYILLQDLHGGSEHVHHAMVVGTIERPIGEEWERLRNVYGEPAVAKVFPPNSGLPEGNENLPQEDEILAGEQAAKTARAKARAKRGATPKMDLPTDAGMTPEMPGA